ncbi:MAG: MMPL family transporter [Pseudomonadota bacterium]
MGNGREHNIVARIVAASVSAPRLVLLGYLAVVVAALLATVNFLEINTDSRGMLNQELPFQTRTAALEDAFPHVEDTIAIAITSTVPDAADAVAAALDASLRGKTGIASVFSASTDPFFLTHGLLYEDTTSVEETLAALDRSADLLAALRDDTTADRLFGSLATLHRFAAGDADQVGALDRMYGRIAAVLNQLQVGTPAALSWQTRGDDNDGTDAPVTPVTRVVAVMPTLDYSQLQPAEPALNSISDAIGALPDTVGKATMSLVRVGVTGEPTLMFEELESVADGIGLSLGASMVCVVILLFICYWSIRRTVVTLLAIVVALVLALGFASVALGPLNLVSIAFVVPLVGLGLDFAIHMTTRAAELERNGSAPRPAFIEAGKDISRALCLSAFTTAAAFLAFVGTDFVGMGQVGIIGSVGVMIAFFVAITFVPAFATLGKRSSPAAKREQHPLPKQAPACAARGLRQGLTAVLIVLAAGAVWLAPSVRFDTDPMTLRDPDSGSMVTLRALLTDPDTAPYRISLIGPEDEINAFADAARATPDTAEVLTPASLVPADQEAKLALIESRYPSLKANVFGPSRLPLADANGAATLADALEESQSGAGAEALSQALIRLGEMTNDASPASAALDDALVGYVPQLLIRLDALEEIGPVSASDLPPQLAAQFMSPDGIARAEVVPRHDMSNPSDRNAFVAQLLAVQPTISGAPLEISRAGQVVSGAMLQATLVAGIIVTLMCLIVLRSWRETVSVLLPLIVAGLLVVGAMVLLELPFNYANVIVLPLIIGLGVDSAIHLALRQRERDSGSVYATSTPRAVFFSGLTTVVAFVSLALSSHRGTASMGELLGLSILIVMATTIIATPTILGVLKRRRPAHR